MPLHNACSYGHLEVAELLVNHGADVNSMDLWQFTPLHEAASKGKMEVCSFLLAHGANPALFNCHNNSALYLAPSQEMSNRISFEYKAYSLHAAASSWYVNRLTKPLFPTWSISVVLIIQSTPLNRVTSVRGHFAPIKRRTLLTKNILY